MKKLMKTQTFRFLAGLIALVLVALIVTATGKIPALRADITEHQVMSLSPETAEIARLIDQDVRILYLAKEESMDVWADSLARKYPGVNSRITYSVVDPASGEAERLAAQVGTALAEKSMVVLCGDRSTVISAQDMYDVTYDQNYYYTTGQMIASEQRFVVDGEIANALLYVTRDDLPVIYELTGHGETPVGGTMLTTIRQNNILMKSLTLGESVPEDASAVLICGPGSDISDSEAAVLLQYLSEGGQMILMTDFAADGLSNLQKVTQAYGMTQEKGIVLESNAAYLYAAEYPHYILADVGEHEITSMIYGLGMKPVISQAGAIVPHGEGREGLKLTALATTSEDAYRKDTETSMTLKPDDGDVIGKCTLAMAAEEKDTRLVWFASSAFISDTDMQLSSGMNSYLMLSTLDWMMDYAPNTAFESPDLMLESLKLPAGMQTIICIAMFVPALVAVVIGLVRKREKKA